MAINAATFGDEVDLHAAVRACERGKIEGYGPSREQIRLTGLREGARLLRQSGLAVSSYGTAGNFTAAEGQERRRRIDDNRRALEEAQLLEARCLLLQVGGLPSRSRDLEGARHMVEDGLNALLADAASAGVRLAIEPHHPLLAAERSVVTSAAEALALAEQLGDEAIGIAVDFWHCWWDAGLPALLDRAAAKHVALVQYADWPAAGAPVRRLPMGDGIVGFRAWRQLLQRAGYGGFTEIEAPMPDIADPARAVWSCVDRFERD